MAKPKERTIELSTIYQELIEKQVEEENPIENIAPIIAINRLSLNAYEESVKDLQPMRVQLVNLYEIVNFIYQSLKAIPLKKIIYLDKSLQLTTEENAEYASLVYGDEPTPVKFTEKNVMPVRSPLFHTLTDLQSVAGLLKTNRGNPYIDRVITTRMLFKAFSPVLIDGYWRIINEYTDFMSSVDRAHFTVEPNDILSRILKIDYSTKNSFKDKRLVKLQNKLSAMFYSLSRSISFSLPIGENDIVSIHTHGHSQILICVYDKDYRMVCLDQFNVKFIN